MKKILSAIIVLSLIVILIYFFQGNKSKETKEANVNQSQNLINTPLSLKSTNPTPLLLSPTQKDLVKAGSEPKIKISETHEDKFDVFEKVEKEWLSKVHELLNEGQYKLYLDMRNRNEAEKALAYQAYHDYLRKKFGNNFKYNISEDQSINEKNINEKYTKELLKLIGEENFKKYLKNKDQFNEELHRNAKSKGSMVIEF